ncbi:MAG: matrixin family metalloprotease [Myxococcales bacterium]|nr:matrixin family metalloprotease [Myxococcales bacterium]
MTRLASRLAPPLLLAALGLGLSGFAHIRTGDAPTDPYLRWSQGYPVPIHVHSAGYSGLALADVRRALENSLATWTAVNNSTLVFVRDAAGRDGDTPAMDGVNVIRFEERRLPPEIDPDSVLAWTSPVSVACTGIILEADITFNAVSFRWATANNARANDIETVALHEVGHLLGLDHSANRDAVMYPSVQERVRRTLQADDLAGVRAIYPAARGLSCTRDADCGGGEVCLYSIDSEDVLGAFCGPPLGAAAPGARCVSDRGPCDAGCANGLCFGNNQCSAVCATDRDCPNGWTCLAQDVGADAVRLCIDIQRCTDASDCPAGQACGLTLDGAGDLLAICVEAGDRPDGAACASGDECAGGICLGTCTRACQDAADCDGGLACTPVDVPLGAGREATVDLCVLPDTPCGRDHDCPEGLACAYLDVGGRLASRCVPPVGREPDAACRVDADCRSGLCLPEGRCSAVCRNDGDCPDSQECGRVQRETALPACVMLPVPDGGAPPPPPRDAGEPPPPVDAGAPRPDAATPRPDAAAPRPDAGAPPADDSGIVVINSGPRASDDGGCRAAPGVPATPGFALLGLALLALRRRRRG